MATYKRLGAQAPAATTPATLYQPGGTNQAAVSTVAVCNRGSTDATFRLAHRVGAATLVNADYFAYDATIKANDTKFITVGISANGTDILECYASNGNLSFSAWGVENP